MNLSKPPIVDRTGDLVRGTWRSGVRLTGRLISDAFRVTRRLRHRPGAGVDDATLASRVRAEISLAPAAGNGGVEVNVVDGIVYLRGAVEHTEQIAELERRARAIADVHGVENLLHVPKAPARSRARAPRQSRAGALRSKAATRMATTTAPAGEPAADTARDDAGAGRPHPGASEPAAVGAGRPEAGA
ncbi:MAG: BON domain-containing protein, partial [Solirubrobacteraceae bacterium]